MVTAGSMVPARISMKMVIHLTRVRTHLKVIQQIQKTGDFQDMLAAAMSMYSIRVFSLRIQLISTLRTQAIMMKLSFSLY